MANAQKKGIVYYGQIESPSMRSASGPDLNAYLVFDTEESYYVTAKDSLENSTIRNQEQKLKVGDAVPAAISSGGTTFRYGKQVYHNLKNDSLYWSQRHGGNIYVKEKTPKIDWKLEKETKKIGNLTCKKATGIFRGREYTVWYTPNIPLPFGPWKLQGLPGLILEARDEYNENVMYFKNIEYPTNNSAPITMVQKESIDRDEEWMTIKDFEKILKDDLVRAYNKSVLIAEQYGTNKPTKQYVMKEVYIESFE